MVKVCKERNVAIQTIKSLAKWKRPEHMEAHHNTWYEPINNQKGVKLAVDWVLSNEDIFLNTSGDRKLLEMILKAANEPIHQPSENDMKTLIKEEKIKILFDGEEF